MKSCASWDSGCTAGERITASRLCEAEPRPSGSGVVHHAPAPAATRRATHFDGQSRSRHWARPSIWRTARVVLGLVLVLGSLIHGLWSDASGPATNAPSATAATAIPLRPIETIRVGDRVITDLPSRMCSDTAVDPATWRLLRLTGDVREDDGTFYDTLHVEALLPLEWIDEHRAAVGGQVPFPLELVEMGLNENALATVAAIEPCPPIQSGRGRVVLTTVNHLNPNVVELRVCSSDGREETLRPTAFHRFYSEDRQDWLCARDVTDGEQLRGLDAPITVISRQAVPGVHRVYNMTVEADHRFHVSSFGVLSHNTGSCPDGPVPRSGGGNQPVNPDPNAVGPHTRIGTQPGQPNDPVAPHGPYRQGFTFGADGGLVGRTDVSDHGRPGTHPDVPHFHWWGGPNGGWGPAMPMPPAPGAGP